MNEEYIKALLTTLGRQRNEAQDQCAMLEARLQNALTELSQLKQASLNKEKEANAN